MLVASALIGSFSHIAFDSFTHGFGWVVRHVDFMQRAVFELPSSLSGRQIHAYDLFQIGGTVIGATVTIWYVLIIGDRQLLRHWYPLLTTPEPTTRSRRRLVIWTVGGATAGLTIAAATLGVGAGQDAIIQAADATLAGLPVGCILANRPMSSRGHSGTTSSGTPPEWRP